MTVLVTGSRHYDNYPALRDALGALAPAAVWTGDARGADSLARCWARLTRTPLQEFKADWNGLGHVAGVIRSRKMVSLAPLGSVLLAFPVGPLDACRGTAATVRLARDAGLKVRVLNHWPS